MKKYTQTIARDRVAKQGVLSSKAAGTHGVKDSELRIKSCLQNVLYRNIHRVKYVLPNIY